MYFSYYIFILVYWQLKCNLKRNDKIKTISEIITYLYLLMWIHRSKFRTGILNMTMWISQFYFLFSTPTKICDLLGNFKFLCYNVFIYVYLTQQTTEMNLMLLEILRTSRKLKQAEEKYLKLHAYVSKFRSETLEKLSDRMRCCRLTPFLTIHRIYWHQTQIM